MQKVRKVVIPVAGYGTRFLPATKAQPKEMLPVVDKPVIQYVVEEAVRAGITEVILVTGASKRAVEDHFDYNYEMQNWLKKQGKHAIRKEIKHIADMANFVYVRQKGPYGNGTPVLCAQEVVGDEPFAVVWGDDIWKCGRKPHIKQLVEVYEKYGDPVITATKIDNQGTKKYGVIEGVKVDKGVLEVKKLMEKPGPQKTKSRIGSFGGYVFTPEIFKSLEKTKIGKGGELWLVDAIVNLMKTMPIYAKIIEGEYYDLGSKVSWLKANIDFALARKDVGLELKKYLRKL